MKARIVRIGNSQGVRIPKAILERSGLSDEVEMEVEDGRIVLRKPDNPRAGWEEAFRAMHEAGDDVLLDGDQVASSSWDAEEWEWD